MADLTYNHNSRQFNYFYTYQREKLYSKLCVEEFGPINILLTGVTGSGKSTTINSIFCNEVSKIGHGVDPETKDFRSFSLNDCIKFWDTPGLGDGRVKDELTRNQIRELLQRNIILNGKRKKAIDIVLVLIEAYKRDYGTIVSLLQDVIFPNITCNRVLVAINQADYAMKGHYWNIKKEMPEKQLLTFLDSKILDIINRINMDTGKRIKRPIYYSAKTGYHLDELMDLIINNASYRK